MVIRANKRADGIGGHLSTFASSAALYEVGFNWFFRGKEDGDRRRRRLLPGPRRPRRLRPGLPGGPPRRDRARQLPLRDRRRHGLSSYPHPRLMPEFWEYPTVSMGLGPINSIYHARFINYLQRPQARRHRRPAGSGPSWATASATSRRPWAPSPWPPATASTTSPGSSTATCSASTARCGATARSSRSWRPCSAAPAGT